MKKNASTVFIPNTEQSKEEWQKALSSRNLNIKSQQFFIHAQNMVWPSQMRHLLVGMSLLSACFLQRFPQSLSDISYVFLSVFIVLAIALVRREILRRLFTYNQWMIEPKISHKTKIWASLVRLFCGKYTNLHSAERLLPSLSQPPALKQTVEKFLTSMNTTLNEDESQYLQKISEEFLQNEGEKINRSFLKSIKGQRNWLTPLWNEYAYLADRNSLSNSTFWGIESSHCFCPDMLIRAACRIITLVRKYSEEIATEKSFPLALNNGTVPMCMNTTKNIFGGYREPCVGMDKYYWYEPWQSDYVIVQCLSYQFVVQVYDSNGKLLSPLALRDVLEHLVYIAKLRANENKGTEEIQMSRLTALPRDVWATTMQEITSNSKQNDSNFDVIAKAMMYMVLECDYAPKNNQEYLDYFKTTNGNCWYDKSLNVIVFKDGTIIQGYEHTAFDGGIAAVISDNIQLEEYFGDTSYFKNGTFDEKTHPRLNQHALEPELLEWNLTQEQVQQFNEAGLERLNSPDNNFSIKSQILPIPRDLLRKNSVKLDGFIQTMMCWADYKLTGRFNQSYEPTTLMFYKDGRTENIRPLTQSKIDFVKSMELNESSTENLNALRKACNDHFKLNKEAMSMKGVDRHLFALYLHNKQLQYDSAFLDFVLSKGMNFSLVTSTGNITIMPEMKKFYKDENLSKLIRGAIFRPINDIMICSSYFMITPNNCVFYIESRNWDDGSDRSQEFLTHLISVMNQTVEMLENL